MFIPKKISEKVVLNNKYVKILQKNFLEKNGKISSYLIYGHNREKTIGTFVLPILENGDIIYIKEYRAGPEKFVISFPVGALEDGFTEVENCKNELEEETGYSSDDIQYLGKSIIENYFEGEAKFYVAKNCFLKYKQKLDIGENIKVCVSSVFNFKNMVLNGEVNFSKTGYCFFLALEKGFINL